MRCNCLVCGTYMVQDEKGLESRCICPQCFSTCSACMGTEQKPLEKTELFETLCLMREHYDASDAQDTAASPSGDRHLEAD